MYGLRIFENIHLVDKKEREVERGIFERLFSFPWRPFKKTKIEFYEVPSTKILQFGSNIFCHPAMKQKILKELENGISS